MMHCIQTTYTVQKDIKDKEREEARHMDVAQMYRLQKIFNQIKAE